jgi:putative ATPase
VPLHLRNAPTKLMKNLGYGKAYRYAHDEAEGYAAGENYLPDGMPQVHWYQPWRAGWNRRSPKNSPTCANSTRRRRRNDKD